MHTAAATISSSEHRASATKKLRQPPQPIIQPPIVGPMLGAKPMAMPEMPITVARLSGGNEVMETLIIMGMVMPAETAWSTRPAMSIGKLAASESTTAPTNSNNSAPSTRLFSRNRRIRNVTAGTVMPSTSI